jgi:hypothetical protein
VWQFWLCGTQAMPSLPLQTYALDPTGVAVMLCCLREEVTAAKPALAKLGGKLQAVETVQS